MFAKTLEFPRHDKRDGGGILLNLKVPEAQDSPTSCGEGGFLPPISLDVALDLVVPIALPPVRLPLGRVTMPERSIYLYGKLPAREGDVDRACGTLPVASPAADSLSPKSTSECNLGLRVRLADSRHDSAPRLRRHDLSRG